MRQVGAPPRLVVAIAAAGLGIFLVVPLAGLLARAPWGSIIDEISAPSVIGALWLSLFCSVCATGLSIVLGVPIAVVLARSNVRGRGVIRAFAILPLVLPPVVGGVALLYAFGRAGPVGQVLGIQLPFTTAGTVLAQTFVAMPFLVLTVDAALRRLDRGYEEAAATLGAAPVRVTGVALRLVAPSLAAGAVLTWARALGEFGATITFAGNVAGRTQTLPLATYLALETNPDGAVAISILLLAVSIGVIAVVGSRVLR